MWGNPEAIGAPLFVLIMLSFILYWTTNIYSNHSNETNCVEGNISLNYKI